MRTHLFFALMISLVLGMMSCDSAAEKNDKNGTAKVQSTPQDQEMAKKLKGTWKLDSLVMTPGGVFTKKDLGDNTVTFSDGKLHISKPGSGGNGKEEADFDFQVAQGLIMTSDFEWTITSLTDSRVQLETPTPDGQGNARYIYKK